MLPLADRAAPITSRSPSPSISPVVTLSAPRKLPEMVCVVQPPPAPSFFHHVMSWALLAAPITSRSPSPSISPVVTFSAPLKLPEIVCGPPNGALRWIIVFSHHVMSSSREAAPITSRSPSPSISPSATLLAPLK